MKMFKWKTRYTVLSVLSLSWIVSFMDRAVMAVTIPSIATEFALSPLQMGGVMSAFFAAYSISQIPGGFLSDKFGVRRVATAAMLWWSVFTAITGSAANLTQMLIARFSFGLGEGVFPACAFKTVAVWFPKSERATANAIKMACGPLGAAIAPIFVVHVVSLWGWRAVFHSLFLPGVIMAALFWLFVPDKPSQARRISPEELVELDEGSAPASAVGEKIDVWEVMKSPNVLKCFLALFFFDIAYWGFTTWLPTYLVKARGFSMVQMGFAASLPNVAGVFGAVLGGWISDRYFSKNRRFPIVASQVMSALLLYLTFSSKSTEMMVICQTLAGFTLSVFFSTFWAIPMNTVPVRLMGVTSGIINMAGQIAATVSPLLVGFLVGSAGGSFALTFAMLIVCTIVSAAIILSIARRVET